MGRRFSICYFFSKIQVFLEILTLSFSEILDFLTEDVDGGSSRSLIMQGEPSPAGIIVRMYITVTQDGTPCENWAE